MVNDMEKKYRMTKSEINHYRRAARTSVRGKDAYEISMLLAADLEHYSDRWNPARIAYVMEVTRQIVERCKRQYDYDPAQWDEVMRGDHQ